MAVTIGLLADETKVNAKPSGLYITAKYGVFQSVPTEIVTYATALSLAPKIGDAGVVGMPGITGVFCADVDIKLASEGSTNQYFITCQFEPPSIKTRLPSADGPCQIEANAVAVQKKIFQNNQGAVMYVTATDALGNALPPQPVEADIQFPMTYITAKRLEPVPYTFNSQPYVGAVNSTVWRNYAARQVLCVAIKTSDEQGGVMVSYEFQAFGLSLFQNQNSWDFTEVYKDPQTKEPITENLGAIGGTVPGPTSPAFFRVYGEANFNALNITNGN